MSTLPQKTERSFFGRLLIALLKFILFVVLTAGVVGLSIIVAIEIQRGQARTSTLESQVELLRQDVNTYLLEPRYAPRLSSVEGASERQAAELASLTAAKRQLESDLAAQAVLIASLQTALDEETAALRQQVADQQALLADLLATTSTITQNLTVLNNGVSDLQNDVVSGAADVDKNSAAVRTLTLGLEQITAEMSDLQAAVAQERAAYRLWGLLLRTQLALANEQGVVALALLKQADTAVVAWAAIAPDAWVEPLAEVQEQLLTAAEVLPTDAAEAAELIQAANETVDDLLLLLSE